MLFNVAAGAANLNPNSKMSSATVAFAGWKARLIAIGDYPLATIYALSP